MNRFITLLMLMNLLCVCTSSTTHAGISLSKTQEGPREGIDLEAQLPQEREDGEDSPRFSSLAWDWVTGKTHLKWTVELVPNVQPVPNKEEIVPSGNVIQI